MEATTFGSVQEAWSSLVHHLGCDSFFFGCNLQLETASSFGRFFKLLVMRENLDLGIQTELKEVYQRERIFSSFSIQSDVKALLYALSLQDFD